MVLHSYIHQLTRPFPCDICLRSFVTKYALKLHMKNHAFKSETRENFPEVRRENIRKKVQEKENRAKISMENNQNRIEEVETNGVYVLEIPDYFDLEKDDVDLFMDENCEKNEDLEEQNIEFVGDEDVLETCENDESQGEVEGGESDERCDEEFQQEMIVDDEEITEEEKFEVVENLEKIEDQYEVYLIEDLEIENIPSSEPKKMQESSIQIERTYKTKKIENINGNVCNYCKKEFDSLEELLHHNQEETAKRPFECEICQFRFKQKGKLKRHLMIHNQQKDFKCNICGIAFIQNYTLKQHIMTHLGL